MRSADRPLPYMCRHDRPACGPHPFLTLGTWEKRHGRLPDNCCVAMNSGWAQHLADPARFTGKDAGGVLHFPGFSPEAADWLLRERRVAGIAVDTISLNYGASKDYKTHYRWLGAGHWGIENGANLDAVPPLAPRSWPASRRSGGRLGGRRELFALV